MSARRAWVQIQSIAIFAPTTERRWPRPAPVILYKGLATWLLPQGKMFRLQAKLIFLTYPQCNKDGNELLLYLLELLPDCERVRVAREKHKDGEYHLHACIRLPLRLTTRNERYFDWDGFHPNIQPGKHWGKMVNYLGKDNDCYDYPDDEHLQHTLDDAETFDWIGFASTATYVDFICEAVQQKLPFLYAKEIWSLTHETASSTIEEDTFYGPLEERFHNIEYDQRPIVLIGRSGVGKTRAVIRLCTKPALWVRHIDTLKDLKPFHKSIIFDDMDFSHLPRTAQIHLLDSDEPSTIHRRYGTTTIPAGMEKWFTTNKECFLYDDAINRRYIKINV